MIEPPSFQNLCGQTSAGHLLLAKGLYEAGHLAAAVAALDRAIEHSPQLGMALLWKGILLHRLGRELEALASLEQAIQCDPESAGGWFALAILQFELGQTESAANSIHRSLALDSENPRAHSLHGSIAIGQGNLLEAIAADREVLRISPGLSQTRLRLALSLQESGDEPAAIDEVLTCLRMQSADVNTRICLANLLLALGQVELANAECRMTADLFPKSPHALLRLAQIHADRDEDDAAIAAARAAIERVPKHLECEMLLGRIRLKQGNTAAAIQHANAALAIDGQLFEAKELINAAEAAASSGSRQSSIDLTLEHREVAATTAY